jgi:hypothetical protein
MGNLGLSLGLGGEVATWMAANAVPIVGTVLVVAGSLIYNWLESKKGGPKSGGYAQSGAVDLSGTESYGGRWFTPNTNDADVQKIITGITTDYATLVKALRGTSAAGLGFALGYDTDPQGKAPNRVHAGVWAGGQQIYNMAYSDLGRDQATLDATLALEAKRMLIAALKASDLPGQLGKMFSSLQIENLTAETADNILKFSQAYLELYDILNASPVDDALEAIELAAGGASAALDKQAEALQALIDQYDGTADSTVALATATKAYYAATVALVIQIEQAKKALAALFAGSIKEYTFAKLDKGGQYKYLQDEIDRYYAELKTSSNPGRVEELAKYIDADMREAFGLLTPEQQSSLADQFIQMAEEVNKTASDQLSKAEQAQEEKLNALLTQIQAALDAAAEKIFKGGTAVGEGGADIKEAAAYLVRAGGDSLVTG